MSETFDLSTVAMGWQRDLPDFRDYTPESTEVPDRAAALGKVEPVKEMISRLRITPKRAAAPIPAVVDLRSCCSPIENQASLGSCTAHAGVGAIEYYERRAYGRHIDASRRFLYKTTRNLLHWTGDTGAYLRTTMGAMALFGVPPEEYWLYNIPQFDVEPPAFCYAFGQNYQSLKYFRLDPSGTVTTDLLHRIKLYLHAGIPSMFGFTVFSSYSQASATGMFPFPTARDRVVGGHAVLAVGYDDKKVIKNQPSGPETKGALLIRNSWGTGWGDAGYGWLPYEYVIKRLAVDWWVLLKSEWIDTGAFGL